MHLSLLLKNVSHPYLKTGTKINVIIAELSPRTVAEAFYNGETENELRRMGKVDYRFKKDSDREECMTMIETFRRERIYPHNAQTCTKDCKQRGIFSFRLFFVGGSCLANTARVIVRWATYGNENTCIVILVISTKGMCE